MNDIRYIIQLICQRRGVKLRNIQSVAFSTGLSGGVGTIDDLLSAVVDNFYYIQDLKYTVSGANIGGAGAIYFTDLGPMFFAPAYIQIAGAVGFTARLGNFETDFMTLDSTTWTTGHIFLSGTVFQVTTAP